MSEKKKDVGEEGGCEMKGSLHDSAITVLEAELTALKRGLTEAVDFGINHISIYCDELQIYELVLGYMETPSDSVFCFGNVSKTETLGNFMETLSEISISMPPVQTKTCLICFDEDFEAEQMFSVGLCGHQFCVECVKQHIRVGMLEGSVMRCPHYCCETKLTLTSCANLLTPKLREMWERKMEEESIPVADRVYCPNPMCSALVSITGISKSRGSWIYEKLLQMW
ncbi:unnamed protein product [Arabis nemorensis]|uniref:RING-type domain-containing protein n=1 Tax=Arabis nemorensis TaxID=586526 RepID=A0A565CEZ0_9BRAS|nr:unnamed protein product [Arabis nemorensis]